MLINETIAVLSKSNNSITVRWEIIKSIPESLIQFYGYAVKYRETNVTNYTEVVSRTHNSSNGVFTVDVSNLNFNTIYDIEVSTFREMDGERDFGSSYQTLQVKTTCTAPDIPSIWKINTSITDFNHIPNITVYYQNVGDLNPNCDRITNITLNYHMMGCHEYSRVTILPNETIYTIIPDKEAQYVVYMTVTNNEGYSSDSEEHTINIIELHQSTPATDTISVMSEKELSQPGLYRYAAPSASVSVIIIVAIVVCVIVVLLWKRRRKRSKTDQRHVNRSFTNDEMNQEFGENALQSFALNGESCSAIQQQAFQPATSGQSDVTTSQNSNTTDIGEQQLEEPEDPSYANSAIHIANFEGYLVKRKRKINGLYKEYEVSSGDAGNAVMVVSTLFSICILYDDTRVILEADNGSNDDYINANYVTNKCRTVHHFHFKTWEDKGNPRYGAHTLLAFMNRVHSFDEDRNGPLIVHCSAGVGRTGTFIALDILQKTAIKEKTVDIYSCVDRLRRERMIMVQTKTVCTLKQTSCKQSKMALNEENRNKNRNLEIVPDDSERLFISGRNGNYINAVSVDTCIPYWPEELHSKKIFDQIEVELLAIHVDNTSDFIVRRDFRVREIKEAFSATQIMTIRHFQLTSWPNDQTFPLQRTHLLDMMDQLQRLQQHSKGSSPKRKLLVHCFDGGSRCGMFCGASLLLDRMKEEQDINVYHTIRSVSRNRPQFFTNFAEYQFLYQMAVEYLIESDQYVNV
ncbi:hypothetical protein LSH36_153g00013 [Paralvinella palmiformis]|uniref:Protein-tyrosine-phosphatase n=1 Tax=Paralvinella palmiformis TaxID=53620 RepID=A0AAD9JVH3_9ANNE|nr:hypothetical protein LSH36_153g00013 [Paralvinella palmiformis]